MSRRNPLAAIEARQRAEEAQRHMQQTAAENSKMKVAGRWEQSTAKKVEAQEYYRTMDRIQARQDDVLVARRERLAALLLGEKESHDAMIAGLAETDDQRKERLMQHAKELRAQREVHRKGQSDMRMAQMALEQSAAVRQATSNLKILQAAEERHRQLEDAQRRKLTADEEKRFFDEQWLENQKAQNARARDDLERKHQLARQNTAELGVQVRGNEARKAQDRDRQRGEDAEFFKLLKDEQRAEFDKQEARRKHRVALAAEMKERNEELRRIKQDEYLKLRKEDQALLDDILREIAETERKEADDKAARRKAAMDHMRKVEAQMGEQAESESALDKLWQEENDREWAKREQRWLADQDRREALLRSVFEARRAQVTANREADAQAAHAKRSEHEEMVQTIQRMRDEDLKSFTDRRAQQQEVQGYLARQIATRDNERAKARDSWRTELTDTQRYEAQMSKEIEAEIKRLNDARPERYKDVALVKKRNGLAGLENL